MFNKRIIVLAILLVFVSASAHARKTRYVATNHRFNYVSINEIKGKDAEDRGITQPAVLEKDKVASALRSIYITKKNFGSKKVHLIRLFNDDSIEFLSENMTKAFSQASSSEEIGFSYLLKDPLIIIRNDRLVIGYAWVHNNNEIYFRFAKLYAQITGDVDKRGEERKAIDRSTSLRVALKEGPGQKKVGDDILIVNIDSPELASANTVEAAPQIAPQTEIQTAEGTVEERLSKLNNLKNEGLITDSEYKKKKKEILKGL